MTFKQLQIEVSAWSEKNFPNNKPHHPLLGLQEEVGELAHAHLKMEQGIRGTRERHLAAKDDAVGDIVVYLADYCSRNFIDLQSVVESVWGQVKNRDWKQNPMNGEVKDVESKGNQEGQEGCCSQGTREA